MNGYIGRYKNQRYEVYADTTAEAQQMVMKLIPKQRARIKSYDISIMLAEINGEPVIHSGAEL